MSTKSRHEILKTPGKVGKTGKAANCVDTIFQPFGKKTRDLDRIFGFGTKIANPIRLSQRIILSSR
jgi:hypothetical protein